MTMPPPARRSLRRRPRPSTRRPGASIALGLGALLAGAAESPAQPAPAPELVREAALAAHIGFLADDRLGGRGTGTPGYDLAALYVASQLAGYGLEPAGVEGDWLQPVPLRRSVLDDEASRLTLQRRGRRTTLDLGRDAVLRPHPGQERVELDADVVFVGHGITDPDRGWDDYAGVDVAGKVVAVLEGAPPSFASTERAFHSAGRTKSRNAADHGAIGMLTLVTPEREELRPWSTRRRGASRPRTTLVDAQGDALQVEAMLGPEAAAALVEASGRRWEGVVEAAAGAPARPFPLATRLRATVVSRQQEVVSHNVAGALRGADPRLRDEWVVYSAHLDHVGTRPNGDDDADIVYNGAYDNASGVAILLELARAFAELPRPPARSILFLAVTAEESGMLGSEHFVAAPTVPLEALVANFNLDMFLMLFPVADVVAYGAEHSTLGEVVAAAAAEVGFEVSPDPLPEEVVFARSDQFSFVRAGVPAIFLTHGHRSRDPAIDGAARVREWMRSVYHSPHDDNSQEMFLASGARFAHLNFLVGLRVANAAERPRWHEGDFFGRRFAGATE